MSLRNQLEPDALLGWFYRHPPPGFVLLQGGDGHPPAFEADFDLQTTLDPLLKRRLKRWPLHRWWSRWLRLRAGFVGTTVSEYALLVSGNPQLQAADVLQRWCSRFPLLVVKDLPHESPLLCAEDNLASALFMQACLDKGCIAVEGQALAYVAIDFANVDAYLARLSHSRRQNLRRKLRSRAGLRIERLFTGSAFESDDFVDDVYTLYEAVHAQSEIHFDKLSRSFLAGVLRDGSASGVVFTYRRLEDGKLIGWNLCFEYAGKLIDKYIGLRYPSARENNLYFVSWIVNLEFALERGLTHYVAGWTDPEVKRQLGANFTFTRHAVYIRNPVLRILGRLFASAFEGDRAWARAAP